MDLGLYPHQMKAVNELDNGKILWGGVGTGKSRTAMAYYVVKEAPKDIFIITTAKKRDSLDWEGEASRYGIGKDAYASTAGVLTVDSWNNIAKYTDVQDAFFIFDEQRIVGSGAWAKAFVKIAKRNNWILLSATPGDTWLDYIPVFVANGFYKNRTEFKRTHVVYSSYTKFPKVERYLEVGKLIRLRNSLLVHMPYQRHTVRRPEIVSVKFDKESFHNALVQRWNVFEERPIRHISELFSVIRRIVNSDISRIEALKCLMEKHPKLIVFYNFDYELEMLRSIFNPDKSHTTKHLTQTSSQPLGSGTYILERDENCSSNEPFPEESKSESESSGSSLQKSNSKSSAKGLNPRSVVIAEWNGHKHEEIPKSDSWLYLVQYTAGSEGWNCVETDAMVFFSLTYSYKQWEQAFGRIDRLNTPFTDLYYYILMSDSMIDKAIKKSLDSKHSFNESSLKL